MCTQNTAETDKGRVRLIESVFVAEEKKTQGLGMYYDGIALPSTAKD